MGLPRIAVGQCERGFCSPNDRAIGHETVDARADRSKLRVSSVFGRPSRRSVKPSSSPGPRRRARSIPDSPSLAHTGEHRIAGGDAPAPVHRLLRRRLERFKRGTGVWALSTKDCGQLRCCMPSARRCVRQRECLPESRFRNALVLPHVILLPNASSPMLPIHGGSGDTAARHPGVLRICACLISPRNLVSNRGKLPARSAGGTPVRNDADVLTGNVSGEAMTPGGNIFADAMRGRNGGQLSARAHRSMPPPVARLGGQHGRGFRRNDARARHSDARTSYSLLTSPLAYWRVSMCFSITSRVVGPKSGNPMPMITGTRVTVRH